VKRQTLLAASIALLTASGIALAISTWAMKDRLTQRDNPMVYFQDPIPYEAFDFRGEPVTLTLVNDPEDIPAAGNPDQRLETDPAQDDTMALRLDFRGESIFFPLRDPMDQQNFPGATPNERLALIGGWFKVLQFVDGVSSVDEIRQGLADGSVKTRLAVAARYQPPELEPTWAAVQRQNWLYRIAELKPEADDPIELQQRTYRELDAIGTPGRRTEADLIPNPDQRAEQLWLHYTMQQVTPPRFFRAKDRDLDLALDAMGWTWPAALAAGFGIVGSVILIGFAIKAA